MTNLVEEEFRKKFGIKKDAIIIELPTIINNLIPKSGLDKIKKCKLPMIIKKNIIKTYLLKDCRYFQRIRQLKFWKEKRKEIIKNKKCELCNSTIRLTIHHKSGEAITIVPLNNLCGLIEYAESYLRFDNIQILCGKCHFEKHFKNQKAMSE